MNGLMRFIGTCCFALLLLIAPVRAEEAFTEVNESVEFLYSTKKKVEEYHLIKSEGLVEPPRFSLNDKAALNYTKPLINLPKLFLLYHELKLCE